MRSLHLDNANGEWRTGESVHCVRIVPEKVSGRRIFGPSQP
jgi:hypothetical protein